MIHFKKIKLQNFLSVGNNPVEISLDNYLITTVTGENGSAKSAVCIDSIYYALYGKAFRKVKLSNLINSINNKNLLVELDFSINENEYKIIRGQKPSKFEIYVNDNLKQQMPNVKDYQAYLTTHVLKMDEKTFRQLVIIGSSSYTPFMSLSASERRVVIEDLLRIDIFSYMKDITKKYITENNSFKSDLEYKIELLKTKIDLQKKANESKLDEIKAFINDEQKSYTNLLQKRNDCINECNSIAIDIDTINKTKERYESIKDSVNKFLQLKAKKSSIGEMIDEQLIFFHNNKICPTCSQELNETFVLSKIDELNTKKDAYNDFVTAINKKITDIQSDAKVLYTEYNNLVSEYNKSIEFKKKLSIIQSNIDMTENKIKLLQSKLELESKKKFTDITEYQIELDNLQSQLTQIEQKEIALSNIALFLKDDGIKSIIIKKYLPVINTLIKKYLSIIEFNIQFEFDENFSEIIKSKTKESFEYNNFSEGERLRIDTAIMFAFRELAKIQSSISTNLLILDEFDRGTLDYQGFQSIVNILQVCKNENILIISHSPEYFTTISDRILTAKKKNGFSMLLYDK